MRQHVEPAAVRHSHHDFARAECGRELERGVEHRHRHVHTLDREAFLAEVGALQEPLEGVHQREPGEQAPFVVCGERLAVLARFDHPAQPHALFVTRDVLHLVGDGAAIGAGEVRQRLGKRGARDVDAQHVGGNARHRVGCEPERRGVERRIAGGLGAERVEMRRAMPEAPDGADEGHGGGDGLGARG